MKALHLLIFLATLFLASCSWITTFAVANSTDNKISISYVISSSGINMPACPDDNFVLVPRIVKSQELEALSGSLKELPEVNIVCDKNLRTVKILLEPNHAVSLFQAGTYTGFDVSRNPDVLTKLTIEGEHGSLKYTGAQVARDFIKHSTALYVLTY